MDPRSPNSSPDEGMRILIPQYMYENHSLPTGYEPSVIYGVGYWSYAFYPQFLGSIISAFCMFVFSAFTHEPNTLIFAARLSSVLFGVITVCFFGKTIELLFKHQKHKQLYAYIGMLLMAFWPQVAFLSGYVNNDIVGLAGVSIIVYACMSAFRDSWRISNAALLGIGMTVCLLGYINSCGFVLFAGMYFVITLYAQLRNQSFKKIAALFAVTAVIPLVLAGPFYLRNAHIHNGDFLGMKTFKQRTASWEQIYKIDLQRNYQDVIGGGMKSFVLNRSYKKQQFNSFIATFGAMNIVPKPAYTNIFKGVVLISLFGVVMVGVRYVRAAFREGVSTVCTSAAFKVGVFLLGSSITTIALSVYYTLRIDYQPQGRYVIYIVVPMLMAFLYGIHYIISKIIAEKYQKLAILTLIALYICNSVVIFTTYVW